VDAAPRGPVAGGILSRDLITFVGQAATYGFDPMQLVRAEPLELELYVLAVHAAVEHQGERDRALARAIVGEYAAARKRGR
jgi:hypothetical protein